MRNRNEIVGIITFCRVEKLYSGDAFKTLISFACVEFVDV